MWALRSVVTKRVGRVYSPAAKPFRRGEWVRVAATKAGRIGDDEKLWGRAASPQKVLDYVRSLSRVPQVIKELHEMTLKEISGGKMTLTTDQLPFLAMLTHVSRAKNIVEIGTFTGVSALQFALATGDDGRVITLDISDQHLDLARKHWKKAGVAHKIDARVGDGLDLLKHLKEEGYGKQIDLAFVDANKLAYDHYYEELLTLVRDDGLILIDNTLWYGQVVEETNNGRITQTMRAFNEKLFNDSRIRFVIVMAGDGLDVCQVLSQEK